jgi:hypothetical protein
MIGMMMSATSELTIPPNAAHREFLEFLEHPHLPGVGVEMPSPPRLGRKPMAYGFIDPAIRGPGSLT